MPLPGHDPFGCAEIAKCAGIVRQYCKKWPLAFVGTLLITFLGLTQAAQAENTEVTVRRSLQRTDFTNNEIIDGFFKIGFGGELQLGHQVERIRKFAEPVRVFVINKGNPDRRAEMAGVINDIRSHVRYLDIATIDDWQAANVF